MWLIKEEQKAKVKNRYNQESFLTPTTIWKSNKTQEQATHKRAFIPLPAGNPNAAWNRKKTA